MNVEDAIRSRLSARAFTDKQVGEADLRGILETARWSPSGGNCQPWHVYALSGASMAAFRASPIVPGYASAKAGIVALTISVASSLRPLIARIIARSRQAARSCALSCGVKNWTARSGSPLIASDSA